MRKPLLALAVSAFGIGTSEFIIMGLLPDLAHSFQVSIPKTGILVSGYALSVTLGSPLVALALSRMDRKRALLILMGMFVAGNALCALAPTFLLLLCARILTALCHGAFFGIGSIVASHLVPRSERAQAIALMFSGLTLANVLGVPAGTALGQAFGWRFAFWALVPIGLIAGLGLLRLVPSQPAEKMHLKHEFHAVLRPQVQLVLALSTLSSVSLFCVFTYIAPILEQVTHLSPAAVTRVLVVFGVGITLGNLLGGRLADWKQMPVIIGGIVLLIVIFLAMPFFELTVMPAVVMVFVWGLRPVRGWGSPAGTDRGPGERRSESGLDLESGCVQSWKRSGRKPWRHHADRRHWLPISLAGQRGGRQRGAAGCAHRAACGAARE